MGLVVIILDSTGLAPGPWVLLGCPPESSHKAPGVLQLPPLPASASFPPTAQLGSGFPGPVRGEPGQCNCTFRNFAAEAESERTYQGTAKTKGAKPERHRARRKQRRGRGGEDHRQLKPRSLGATTLPDPCMSPIPQQQCPCTRKTLVKTAPKD